MAGRKKILWILFTAFLLLLAATVPGQSPLRGELHAPKAHFAPAAATLRRALSTGEGAGVYAGGLDLNAANAAALTALPGVGPVLAGRMVDWRCENGAFLCAEDLLYVRGIGEKTWLKICRYTEEPEL